MGYGTVIGFVEYRVRREPSTGYAEYRLRRVRGAPSIGYAEYRVLAEYGVRGVRGMPSTGYAEYGVWAQYGLCRVPGTPSTGYGARAEVRGTGRGTAYGPRHGGAVQVRSVCTSHGGLSSRTPSRRLATPGAGVRSALCLSTVRVPTS